MKMPSASIRRQLRKIRRHEHHPIIHKIAAKQSISKRTIFYMKEYGPRSHIASVILRESLFALVVALVIGTLAGISLQAMQDKFLFFLPLLILFPALNDMMGDYGMIMVSRLSTLAFTKNVIGKWWQNKDVRKIIMTIAQVSIMSSLYIGLISSAVAYLKGFPLTIGTVVKVTAVSVLTSAVMTSIVVLLASSAVFYVYRRKEDPNNLVMPLMTPLADLGTIITFGLFVYLIF